MRPKDHKACADGTKALPRLIEIIDEYDPTRHGQKKKGERFDACF